MRDGLGAQPEVQAAVVNRIEAGLRAHLLRLLPVPVAGSHSRADGAAIAVDSDQ